jgi:hypothetical protein
MLYSSAVAKNSFFKFIYSDQAFITLICIGIVILRSPNLILFELNVDESEWISGAAAYWNGSIMWKELSGTTSGPLVFVPLGVMIPFGGLNYASIRLFGLLFCIIPSIYLLWRTILLVYGAVSARLTIIPVFIFFACTQYFDFVAYNSEHIPMMLVSLALYLFFRFQDEGKERME